MSETKRCHWRNSDPEEAAARHEGPHVTWCPHYSQPPKPGPTLPVAGHAAERARNEVMGSMLAREEAAFRQAYPNEGWQGFLGSGFRNG